MSERKWTPPSWQSVEYRSGYYQALHDSAAQDLYEALEKCVKEYESMAHSEFDGVWSKEDFEKEFSPFYAALAKARGEQ